jgi:plasmid replication initiation protein
LRAHDDQFRGASVKPAAEIPPLPCNQITSSSQGALPIPSIVVPSIQISRDEMNLAEFPLTVLSTRSNGKEKTLEFSDTIRGKNGETVTRRWIITGADKFGLPTASDDEVLLGLLKLTVQNEFRDRKVYFTRYELLRILQWTTEGRSYQRLQRALDRLSGVRIKASNAFYDNENKTHTTRNFGIIDAYEINDGRDTLPKPSFFIWSDVLFKSFQVGFIKKLDLQFYLALRSAVSKRLYRYLDKHFWYRSKIQINVFTLAHEKIGISRNYRHVSSLRQQLDPAIEELINANFLSGAEYV